MKLIQMGRAIGFVSCMLGVGVNVALYLDTGNAVNVGAAVFCGGCAVFIMLLD